MYVAKRDGRKEEVRFDKITFRIRKLCYGLNMKFVDPVLVAQKVVAGLYAGVSTVELDNMAAEVAAAMCTIHPDYGTLAARIAVSNLQKETKKVFSEVVDDLYNFVSPVTGRKAPLVDSGFHQIVMANAGKLNSAIVNHRDYDYTYYGFKLLEKDYLLRINGKVVERPQHMFMRVAIAIHKDDLSAAISTYNLLSEKWYIHGSATLLHAGLRSAQVCSSFLVSMMSDSIEGIYDTLARCATVSKHWGSVGLNIHCIRAKGTFISGTNGVSNGILPMLRVFNNTARYVDQGDSERPGAFAIYLEPWHSDIFDFLSAKKSTGKDENRARDLSYALWIPDLFMRRVEADQDWSLMCPHECPGLQDVWGADFDELYERYEKERRYKQQIKAQQLWYAIIESQLDTGGPCMLYKDACNGKSNQQNLGTIMSAGLCAEVMAYSSPDEVATGYVASIALNKFVTEDGAFDFEKLHQVTKAVATNLNKLLDVAFYPMAEARRCSQRHRPICIGVQGLADAFVLLRYPYESDEAILLNRQIFETIYHAALEASCELAAEFGPYETYEGSPASKGILQYDMWGVSPSDLWNWDRLKESIGRHGLRNSLLVALVPTSSTALIMGNSESTYAYASNTHTRRVGSTDFPVINGHLLKDLVDMGLWNEQLRDEILQKNGSVSEIEAIPEETRRLYKTAWEVSQKTVIDMAVDRAPFVDQSQSLLIHLADPSYARVTSMHFYGWKNGLKTGMYCLKTPLFGAAARSVGNKLTPAAKLKNHVDG